MASGVRAANFQSGQTSVIQKAIKAVDLFEVIDTSTWLTSVVSLQVPGSGRLDRLAAEHQHRLQFHLFHHMASLASVWFL